TLLLPHTDTGISCEADALVRSRAPGRLLRSRAVLGALSEVRVQGTRADRGIRPTMNAEFRAARKRSGPVTVRTLIGPTPGTWFRSAGIHAESPGRMAPDRAVWAEAVGRWRWRLPEAGTARRIA